jgi:hypothetical protein
VLVALIGVKLVYWAILLFSIDRWQDYESSVATRIHQVWFPEGWPPEIRGKWSQHFATWDADHYLYLSAEGYGEPARSIAFYPLWPLLIRAVARVTGLSHIFAGLLMANFCSIAGWLLFHRITAERFNERTADYALTCLIVFPGSLFFQFIYTESLFFLLLMGLWWGMENRRHDIAWIAAFLAPLTRGVGLFAVLPIGWYWLSTRPWSWLPQWMKRKDVPFGAQDFLAHGSGPILLLFAPILGWGAYLGLMWVWAGNPWAGVEAQKYWGAHSISNLWDIPKFAQGFMNVTAWHDFRGSILDRVGFLLVLYALPVLWRMGKDLLVWTLMLGVLPAMSGTFVSILRFESCAFPVFLAAGSLLAAAHRCWALVLVPFLVMHAFLVWQFVNYRWAG